MDKEKKRKIIYAMEVIAGLCLVICNFMGPSGKNALTIAAVKGIAFIIFGAVLGLIIFFMDKKKVMHVVFTMLFAICCFVLGFLSLNNVIKDKKQGPQQTMLHRISTSNLKNSKGFSRTYSVKGLSSSGVKMDFKISESDYKHLQNASTIKIEYYENCDVIIDYEILEKYIN